MIPAAHSLLHAPHSFVLAGKLQSNHTLIQSTLDRHRRLMFQRCRCTAGSRNANLLPRSQRCRRRYLRLVANPRLKTSSGLRTARHCWTGSPSRYVRKNSHCQRHSSAGPHPTGSGRRRIRTALPGPNFSRHTHQPRPARSRRDRVFSFEIWREHPASRVFMFECRPGHRAPKEHPRHKSRLSGNSPRSRWFQNQFFPDSNWKRRKNSD
jgi:hypothetical protein